MHSCTYSTYTCTCTFYIKIGEPAACKRLKWNICLLFSCMMRRLLITIVNLNTMPTLVDSVMRVWVSYFEKKEAC